jgi:hypothetical protein
MSEINHPKFNGERFATWLARWPEGPRLDFKSEVLKVDDEAKQFNFFRHLIAFANVARRTGKPCWIVFGIGNDEKTGKRIVLDVKRQYPGRNKPKGWDNPQVSVHDLQTDGVEKIYTDLARDWIEPLPGFGLRYGEYDGKFVSYLEIAPKDGGKPYCLKRNYVPEECYKGDVFIRLGSSTIKVPPEEVEFLLPARKIAYLTRQDWQSIVERAKFESEIFFDQLKSFPLYDDATKKPVFDVILDALEAREQVIALVGGSGEGKTTVMNALVWELARRVNIEGIRDFFGDSKGDKFYSVAEDLEVVPPALVPIKVELRKAFENVQVFEREILKSMLGSVPDDKTLEHYWRIPGSRWALLLDGMDEIVNFDEFAAKLKTWLGQLPKNVQVVLSSRPYALNEATYKQIQIARLSNDQIQELIRQRLIAQETENTIGKWQEIIDFLQAEPEMFEVLRKPRAIDAFLEAWQGRSTALLADSDKMPVRQTIASAEAYQPSSEQPAEIAGMAISTEELTAEGETGFVQVPNEQMPDSPKEEVADTDSPLPTAIYLQKITVYLYTEEHKRHKIGTVNEIWDEMEDAQKALQEVAWQENWQTLTFDKDQMREKLRKWNEYIGFVCRTDKLREYRYLSWYFQSFCAAWFAFEFLTGEEEKILRHINQRREIPITAQVLTFLNQLREANNRTPIILSTGG